MRGTQGWRTAAQQPVWVSLAEASAFCRCKGARVMTEAEYVHTVDAAGDRCATILRCPSACTVAGAGMRRAVPLAAPMLLDTDASLDAPSIGSDFCTPQACHAMPLWDVVPNLGTQEQCSGQGNSVAAQLSVPLVWNAAMAAAVQMRMQFPSLLSTLAALTAVQQPGSAPCTRLILWHPE